MSSQAPQDHLRDTLCPTHEPGRGLTPAEETTTPGTPSPRREMMLGLWNSWVESVSKLASGMRAAPGGLPWQAAWQMSPDQLTGGLRQLGEMAAKDSTLNSILRATDDALNANPLRQVIPVNWRRSPGIAHGLAAVHLPTERAVAATADFNMRQCRLRWTPGTRHAAIVRVGTARAGGFGWRGQALRRARVQGHPIYRTLKEFYLLASDWLLRKRARLRT